MTDKDFEQTLDRIEMRLNSIDSSMQRLNKILTGDDEPSKGLVTQFIQLRDTVANCQATYKDDLERIRQERANKLGSTRIIVTIVAVVVSVFTTVITNLIKGK